CSRSYDYGYFDYW
nr:immunoglobulin heavy chain junction region [Mus musculus]